MATQTVEQVQRLAPYLEGLEKRILQSAFGEFDGETQTSKGLLDTRLGLPQQQVAGLDPLQLAAQEQALRQFGMFQPFVQTAGQLATSGIAQGLGMLDPQKGIQSYMNPYQDAVIDEINRQAAIGQQGLDAQRQNLMQGIMEPFTRLELGSSLLKGTPSGSLSSTFKSATTPAANPFLQGVGAYTALQGAGMGGGTVGK